MFVEIAAILLTSTCLAVFYIAKNNRREKIDFHGKHVVITGGNNYHFITIKMIYG